MVELFRFTLWSCPHHLGDLGQITTPLLDLSFFICKVRMVKTRDANKALNRVYIVLLPSSTQAATQAGPFFPAVPLFAD